MQGISQFESPRPIVVPQARNPWAELLPSLVTSVVGGVLQNKLTEGLKERASERAMQLEMLKEGYQDLGPDPRVQQKTGIMGSIGRMLGVGDQTQEPSADAPKRELPPGAFSVGDRIYGPQKISSDTTTAPGFTVVRSGKSLHVAPTPEPTVQVKANVNGQDLMLNVPASKAIDVFKTGQDIAESRSRVATSQAALPGVKADAGLKENQLASLRAEAVIQTLPDGSSLIQNPGTGVFTHVPAAHGESIVADPGSTTGFSKKFVNGKTIKNAAPPPDHAMTQTQALTAINNFATVAFPYSPEVWQQKGPGILEGVTRDFQTMKPVEAYGRAMKTIAEASNEATANALIVKGSVASGKNVFDINKPDDLLKARQAGAISDDTVARIRDYNWPGVDWASLKGKTQTEQLAILSEAKKRRDDALQGAAAAEKPSSRDMLDAAGLGW